MTVRADHGEATTIAALATAPYPSGLAVIRISGPRTRTALLAIFHSKKDPVKLPRTLVFGDLIDYRSGQPKILAALQTEQCFGNAGEKGEASVVLCL